MILLIMMFLSLFLSLCQINKKNSGKKSWLQFHFNAVFLHTLESMNSL